MDDTGEVACTADRAAGAKIHGSPDFCSLCSLCKHGGSFQMCRCVVFSENPLLPPEISYAIPRLICLLRTGSMLVCVTPVDISRCGPRLSG